MPSYTPDGRPLLIYDGDCDFCSYWVRYWQRLTGDAVDYQPYQSVRGQYPQIPLEDFQGAIQLIPGDGTRFTGAEAAFRILAIGSGGHLWLWLYRWLPGFAWLAEASYRLIAGHRIAAGRVTRLLWGKERQPVRCQRVSWLFLRLLGVVYLSAFASLGVQIQGLVGSTGILPLQPYLEALREVLGNAAYWSHPSLFWINSSDQALEIACLLGIAAAVLVIIDRLARVALAACFVLYLSLLYAGQDFMSFQWDLLLLESGFLAIFLTGGARPIVWLYRWLLFRFMFLSGAVKLLSGDASWANLRALGYHFETQPLPTPLAWHAHQLPEGLLQTLVAAVFVIELVLPFLVFLPRRPRLVAAWGFLLLQAGIILTGNYSFFNLLAALLCLFLLEDRDIERWLPTAWSRRIRAALPQPRFMAKALASVLTLVILATTGTLLWITLTQQPVYRPLATLVQDLRPLRIANNYGLFAVMTTARPEIIIEGSDDGRTWHAYDFRYKPGDPDRNPGWNIPHQPRLDWQLWFAALGSPRNNPWVGQLLLRLQNGSPAVLGLMRHNPFPDQPPRYVRASLYHYRFNPAQRRAETGQVWQRTRLGTYLTLMR